MNFLKDKFFFLFLILVIIFFMQGIINIPVLDRDEARFATATKTMLETKDFIDIKMQEETRYKKPIGIYWAQVFSNYIFGDSPYDKIWVYRIPSLLGIVLSLLLIYKFLKSIYSREVALLSILFILTSFLTISEIHQAKTDGMLFLFITLCNLLVLKAIFDGHLSNHFKLLYWVSMAIGILVKGPIILIFTILPLLALSIIQKRNFFNFIWTKYGFFIFFLISVPWFVLISIKSNGLFWHESVINDLFNKVRSGQESHGFVPGYYTLLIFLFFWPGSIFIPSFFINLKIKFKEYFIKNNLNCFLILYFLLPFVLYEVIPTKLPHYVFPSYVALSILISKEIISSNFKSSLLKYAFLPTVIFPLTIMSIIAFAIYEYSSFDTFFFLIILTFLSFLFLLIFFLKKKKIKNILYVASFHQVFIYLVAIYYLVPQLNSFWIANNINKIIDNYRTAADEIIHFGFNEPSLIFLTSHKAKKRIITKFDENKKILFFLEAEFESSIIQDEKFAKYKLVDQIKGFNYSQGKIKLIKVYANF